MALDPSEVEVLYNPATGWVNLADYERIEVRDARGSRFRRAKPKRSRVQEMAETWRCNIAPIHGRGLATDTVRAVCEWLRGQAGMGAQLACNSSPGHVARAIEVHFLEPR
jgi:hypothetical protein